MTEERPTPEERPSPVEETRLPEEPRRPRTTRYYVALAIAIATVVYLILLIVENSKPVKVHYVFGSSHTRLVWLIIVTGLIGWIWGLATSYLVGRRARRRR